MSWTFRPWMMGIDPCPKERYLNAKGEIQFLSNIRTKYCEEWI